MPWLRIDDQIAMHAKTVACGNAAFGAWVRMAAWSAAQLTDGHVPKAVARMFAADAEVEQLVSVRFLDIADGGYQVHDFLEFNPSREKTLEERAAKRAGGKRGAESRWHQADGISHGSSHATSHGGSHASANAPVPIPIPIPSPPTVVSSAPRKRSRSKPVEAVPDGPDVTALKLHYVERYAGTHQGEQPTFRNWSRPMKALKELLADAGSLDAASAIISNALADTWTAKNRCQPWEILVDINKHRSAPLARAMRPAVQQAPAGGSLWTAGDGGAA